MSADWIKRTKGLENKIEVVQIAAALSIPRIYAAGLCEVVWCWADSETVDGRAGGATPALLDSLVSVTGLGAAMEKAGWLLSDEHGIAFPHFDRHMSQSAKTRALNTNRQKSSRECRASVAPPARQERYQRREEKNRRKNTPPNPLTGEVAAATVQPGIEVPPSLRTDAFLAAWAEWEQHRREIRHKLTPSTTTSQLKDCEGWGEALAIAAIHHSIAAGWQKLVPPYRAAPTSNGNGKLDWVDGKKRAIAEALAAPKEKTHD